MKTNLLGNNKFTLFFTFMLLVGLSSCEKYLELKPDQKLIIPKTMADCQQLLNAVVVMNSKTTALPELLADDFLAKNYLQWNTFHDVSLKAAYAFEARVPVGIGHWYQYETVFYANSVLEVLDEITPANASEQATWNSLRGAALFFRGYSFYHLAQVFAPAYDAVTAKQDLGIPLRLTSDISALSTRANVQATYNQILADLTESVKLLPAVSEHVSQPGKAAAYGMLSRTYLMMRDYPLALESATNSLNQKNTLLDFNQVTTFVPYNNPEVLFDGVAFVNGFTSSRSLVSTALYNSYTGNDKRRSLYFRASGTGYTISRSYTGSSFTLLTGPAVDEMYLNRAECHARAGNKDLALADLNTLLRKRYDATFVDLTAATSASALDLILVERRKELIYRNIRWSDIRRLNKEGRNIVLTHSFPDNPTTFSLSPNDLRYAILIPQEIIDKSGIPQNPR